MLRIIKHAPSEFEWDQRSAFRENNMLAKSSLASIGG